MGDMSLVGPRPLSLAEMRYNPKWRDARLRVRPGMTGLWQVEAHNQVYFNDWIVNDLEYVKHVPCGWIVKISDQDRDGRWSGRPWASRRSRGSL